MDDSRIITKTKLNVVHKSKESGSELGMDVMPPHLDHLTVGPFSNHRQKGFPCLCQSARVGEGIHIMGSI